MNILITGSNGYIGNVLFNKLWNNTKHTLTQMDLTLNGLDITNKNDLETLFKNGNYDLVIHLAAFIDVAEGQKKPLEYYYNNVEGTRLLLETMKEHNCNKIIFSSSASVYGNNEGICTEDTPTKPTSVYGKTKLMGEEIIKDSGIDYIIFRFFNVAGGNQRGNSLIAKIKNSNKVTIYGNDYNTEDGTCIRDFIHVEDIADAILKAIEYLDEDKPSITLNLGSNKGYSVLEVIKEANIPYEIGNKRIGDIIVSICDNIKAKKVLNWEPRKKLKNMIKE